MYEILATEGPVDDLLLVLKTLAEEKASFLDIVGETEDGLLIEVGSSLNSTLLPFVMFGV